MKIEPVGFISPEYLQDLFSQSIEPDWVPVWNKPHGIATEKVYTEAQMLQLVEACAAACEDVGKWPSLQPRHCAESIRELIKELLS